MSDYQQRTEEWAPNASKSEQIFISVCIKECFGMGLIGDANYQEALEKYVIMSAKAWQGAQSTLRKGQLHAIQQLMEFAGTEADLMAEAQKLALIPQTKAERETSMALMEKCRNDLRRQSAPQTPNVTPGY